MISHALNVSTSLMFALLRRLRVSIVRTTLLENLISYEALTWPLTSASRPSDFRTSDKKKGPRINSTVTVTCGNAPVSVPEPALLSPSAVLIKASGGRREGWRSRRRKRHACVTPWFMWQTGREAERAGHEASLYHPHVCAHAAGGLRRLLLEQVVCKLKPRTHKMREKRKKKNRTLRRNKNHVGGV